MRAGYADHLAIGVDLGGSHARATLWELDPLGVVVEAEARLPADDDARSPERVIERVVTLIGELGAPAETPVGVGVAAMIGREGVVVNAPAFPGGWRGAPIGALFEAKLGRRPVIDNDVNAICWGEHSAGAGRGGKPA